MGSSMRKPIHERIFNRIKKTDQGCWEFQGSRDGFGYGKVSTEKGMSPARVHRVIYEHVNGKVPNGLFVLHKCDNPPCCNPLHLYVGTQKENIGDAVKRGRLNEKSKLNLRPGSHGYRGAGPLSNEEIRNGRKLK